VACDFVDPALSYPVQLDDFTEQLEALRPTWQSYKACRDECELNNTRVKENEEGYAEVRECDEFCVQKVTMGDTPNVEEDNATLNFSARNIDLPAHVDDMEKGTPGILKRPVSIIR